MRENTSSGESRRRRERPIRVRIEAQGHLLQVKVSAGRITEGGGDRGEISTFSYRSRKRMLEKCARIDIRRAGFVCFVTLTYPDRSGPPSPAECERDRQVFLKRISRGYPLASAVWRREWESRESGAFVGTSFPHFHLLFFGLPFVHFDTLNALWREVIGYPDYVRTEIKGMKSWRMAFRYVSKYMAKPAEGPGERAPGRATRRGGTPAGGEGRDAARGPGGEAACSLVYGTYLTAKEEGKKGSLGRSWGVFNGKKLPLGERKAVLLTRGRWLRRVQEDARCRWPGVTNDPNCGFTLFQDDPYALAGAYVQLHDVQEDTGKDRGDGAP